MDNTLSFSGALRRFRSAAPRLRQLLSYHRGRSSNIQWGQSTDSIRVGIQCNQYFTVERWRQKLSESSIQDRVDVQLIRSRSERDALLPEMEVLFGFWLSDGMLSLAKRLAWVHFPFSGLEFLEETTLPDHLQVTTSGGIASRSIAEHCLLMALLLLRNYSPILRNQSRRIWDQQPFLDAGTLVERHNTVGVLGLGRNGSEIVNLFKQVGFRVLGYDLFDSCPISSCDDYFTTDRLDEILAESNILIVALPLNAETRNLIQRRELKLLGQEGMLIDISRSGIVNPDELYSALQNRWIRSAAMDVFPEEPLPRRSSFWSLENLLITPHVAGNINLFVDEIQDDFLRRLENYLEKKNRVQE